MTNTVLYLPAIERRVSPAAYVQAVTLAKANPHPKFTYGLITWRPTTGREIVTQRGRAGELNAIWARDADLQRRIRRRGRRCRERPSAGPRWPISG